MYRRTVTRNNHANTHYRRELSQNQSSAGGSARGVMLHAAFSVSLHVALEVLSLCTLNWVGVSQLRNIGIVFRDNITPS
jgi:hypothetical protein